MSVVLNIVLTFWCSKQYLKLSLIFQEKNQPSNLLFLGNPCTERHICFTFPNQGVQTDRDNLEIQSY